MSKQQKRKTSLRKKSKTPYVIIVIVILAAASVGVYAYATRPCTTPNVQARIYTTQGAMNVELFSCDAPQTVSNIVKLANSGFYDNLTWHRIVKGYVIQTGDPTTKNGGGNETAWGNTSSNHTVPLEISSLPNNYSYIGMARTSNPNSGSSQFFINLANNTSLDGSYTVFGKVTDTSSMKVALTIGNLPVSTQCLASTDDDQCQPQNPRQALVLNITILSSG
jgi:cyclophilin family peptidyl-prolyl cis-trans isomerase